MAFSAGMNDNENIISPHSDDEERHDQSDRVERHSQPEQNAESVIQFESSELLYLL